MVDKAEKALSSRQSEILDYIRSELRTRGYAPTIREICFHVGVSSTTSVHRHLGTLEGRGYIKRDPNKYRSIQLTAKSKGEKAAGLKITGKIVGGKAVDNFDAPELVELTKLFDHDIHFALRNSGNAMNEDHLCDGDLVIAKKTENAQDGDVVIVEMDGVFGVKRIFRQKGKVRLEGITDNKEVVYAKSIHILGIVVGVVRTKL